MFRYREIFIRKRSRVFFMSLGRSISCLHCCQQASKTGKLTTVGDKRFWNSAIDIVFFKSIGVVLFASGCRKKKVSV